MQKDVCTKDMLRHAPMFKKKGRGAGRGVYGPGGKGRGKGLAQRDTLSRNWAQKISKRLDSPTAAISLDGRLLAVAEETQAGFQVWVHELDAKGRMNAGRFTLNIRHLSWHQTLPYLCISTDDGKLDVWWEESQGSSTTASRRQLLKGLEGGVRCAALDPQSKLLAAAFTSGQLVILSFPEALFPRIWK
eukprot:g16029.t1